MPLNKEIKPNLNWIARNVFTIKMYLHLNCILMLNWIVWNRTVFDIETVLTLNWIVITAWIIWKGNIFDN